MNSTLLIVGCTLLVIQVVVCYPQTGTQNSDVGPNYQDDANSVEIQNQVKELIAQYLAETSNDGNESDSGRELDNSLPSEFGRDRVREHNRHHHHNRYPVAPAAAAAAIPVLAAPERISAPAAVAISPVNEAARVDPLTQNQTVKQTESASASATPVIPVIVGTPSAPATPIAAAPVSDVATTLAPVAAPGVTTPVPATLPPRSTVDPVHHLNQVNKILGNVANGNIVGIVDESLAIRAPPPVRNLVTNIMKVIFCNPIDRLFRRCAPNQVDASQNSVTG